MKSYLEEFFLSLVKCNAEMMNNDCCIIIPIYKAKPTILELSSINRVMETLGEMYDLMYICGETFDIENYPLLDAIKVARFDDSYFVSNKSYSKLLLSEDFYKPFVDYDYILISQTDSYILNSDYSLQGFMEKDYDYWGAPWSEGVITRPYSIRDIIKLIMIRDIRKLKVGNGGFSLRKVSTMMDLVVKNKRYIKYLWWFNEDLFFSRECYRLGTVAPFEEAKVFAGEQDIRISIKNGITPFGVHAYEKYYKELEEIINSQKESI